MNAEARQSTGAPVLQHKAHITKLSRNPTLIKRDTRNKKNEGTNVIIAFQKP